MMILHGDNKFEGLYQRGNCLPSTPDDLFVCTHNDGWFAVGNPVDVDFLMHRRICLLQSVKKYNFQEVR